MCSILIFQSWFDNYKGKRNHCFTYDSLRSVTTIHKWLFFGLLRLSGCFDQPKGLHCWDIKRTSLPDESIKIGLQKPAQRSVHKCVQKLACKSSEIGAQATKCEEWTSVRFQKATFFEDFALVRKVFVNRKTSSLFMMFQWWSLLLSLNCLVHYNVWMKLWQLSVSLH